ncbi:helix-turn-helix domain-containing protein [Halobellus captivus]|uniref:helix-turn-helix domain-containing protein n=1 Tax=Halobellus captivus TaxID=2592614 RepID=UPI00119DB318|nr:helix-turn-helix domain-containing protein [Halobellus captivus]
MEPTCVGTPNGRWSRTRDASNEDDHDGTGRDGSSSLKRKERTESLLVGTVQLSGGSLALARTLELVTEATFVPDHHTLSPSGKRTLYLSVSGATPGRLKDAFTLDPTVVVADLIETFPDSEVYRITLSDHALLVASTSLELGARARSVRGSSGSWKAQLLFSDRDALVALRQFCSERDIRFGLNSLYRSEQFGDGTSTLTDKQWEALRIAFESGYYDIPRRETQDDLATQLDISTTAVSHRLRRATAQLIQDTIETLGRVQESKQ